MARFFLCLAAAACCLALLVPPVQGRLVGIGLAGGGSSFVGRGHPVSGRPHVVVTAAAAAEEEMRGATVMKAAKPSWSSSSSPSWTSAAAAGGGRLRPELRSVPGGPDPLHHHGSPCRPDLAVEPTTP